MDREALSSPPTTSVKTVSPLSETLNQIFEGPEREKERERFDWLSVWLMMRGMSERVSDSITARSQASHISEEEANVSVTM